ncbi:hypothetical protein [Persicirhabdus sediminis]|uniref:Uncharacterized protein n=1 Tax=Persicirhabdus sediminis TaxID=454144 RepID=A0A8J7SM56_9BACT|nr:hypothetical protein [Persicirhabdus sediminis]MBK1791845.1 hypothetical protein [Persicirhabdus sediminis]
MKKRIIFVTCLSLSLAHAEDDGYDLPAPPEIPADLIDDPHVREELGINEFTAPSIERIFDDLAEVSPLPLHKVKHEIPLRMPLDRTDLALEIGFLIANGFLAVHTGQMDDIEPLARDLNRYGRALGAGERVNRHAASLLENARAGNIDELKKELAATQRDVEVELVHLRDADLAHLISLGGWIRALEVGTVAVNERFTISRAQHLMREDIAEYYEASIGTLAPRISEQENMQAMRALISSLRVKMTLVEGQDPTPELIAAMTKDAGKLVELGLARRK